MNPNETILTRLDQAIAEVSAAARAAVALARSIDTNAVTSRGDDDDWRRMPVKPTKCAVTGFSRTTLEQHIKANDIRSKLVVGKRYYSGTSARAFIAAQPEAG